MKWYNLEKKFHQLFSFIKVKKFLYFLETLIDVKKDNSQKFYGKCANFTDFKRIQVSLIPYVSVSLPFSGKRPLEYFETGKIIFVENR